VPAADAEPETNRHALDVGHRRHGDLRALRLAFLAENHATSFVFEPGCVKPGLDLV
jgi:hypothetical protein